MVVRNPVDIILPLVAILRNAVRNRGAALQRLSLRKRKPMCNSRHQQYHTEPSTHRARQPATRISHDPRRASCKLCANSKEAHHAALGFNARSTAGVLCSFEDTPCHFARYCRLAMQASAYFLTVLSRATPTKTSLKNCHSTNCCVYRDPLQRASRG